MSKLHFQLDHSPARDEYAERGRAIDLRITRELILNPEGLNPDPELESLRCGAPQSATLQWPAENDVPWEV